MIQFDYEGKEYNIPEGWDEINVKSGLNFLKCAERHSIAPADEVLIIQELIETLCGVELDTFDDMSLGFLLELVPFLKEFTTTQESWINNKDWKGPDDFMVNDKLYSYRRSFNELTAGEVCDIKSIYAARTDEWSVILDIAAILIRPAVKMTTEAGNDYYRLTKNSPTDYIVNKKVLETFLLKDVLRIVNFFGYGTLLPTATTNTYTSIRKVMKQ